MSGMFILVHLENKVIISRLLGYIFTNVYTVGVVHILYKHPRGRGSQPNAYVRKKELNC